MSPGVCFDFNWNNKFGKFSRYESFLVSLNFYFRLQKCCFWSKVYNLPYQLNYSHRFFKFYGKIWKHSICNLLSTNYKKINFKLTNFILKNFSTTLPFDDSEFHISLLSYGTINGSLILGPFKKYDQFCEAVSSQVEISQKYGMQKPDLNK